MKQILFSTLTIFISISAQARSADCAAYYTTDPKSVFSSSPQIVRPLQEAKMNSIPGTVVLQDEDYIVTMVLTEAKFSASVFSVLNHRVLKTGHMLMSEAQSFEDVLKIVLERFTYKTPEKVNGKDVYLFYSCVVN